MRAQLRAHCFLPIKIKTWTLHTASWQSPGSSGPLSSGKVHYLPQGRPSAWTLNDCPTVAPVQGGLLSSQIQELCFNLFHMWPSLPASIVLTLLANGLSRGHNYWPWSFPDFRVPGLRQTTPTCRIQVRDGQHVMMSLWRRTKSSIISKSNTS